MLCILIFPKLKIKSYEESKILGLKEKKVRIRMSLGPIQLAVEYS
jgi:hypothetical protein